MATSSSRFSRVDIWENLTLVRKLNTPKQLHTKKQETTNDTQVQGRADDSMAPHPGKSWVIPCLAHDIPFHESAIDRQEGRAQAAHPLNETLLEIREKILGKKKDSHVKPYLTT